MGSEPPPQLANKKVKTVKPVFMNGDLIQSSVKCRLCWGGTRENALPEVEIVYQCECPSVTEPKPAQLSPDSDDNGYLCLRAASYRI